MVELSKINFLGCTHGSIWVLDKQEAKWAKKVGLEQTRKFDWIYIDKVLEMNYSFNYADQLYVKIRK
jgi:hypothetical protein